VRKRGQTLERRVRFRFTKRQVQKMTFLVAAAKFRAGGKQAHRSSRKIRAKFAPFASNSSAFYPCPSVSIRG
jgi:hypothetical protein